jgi:retron-type reverse transcriptase
MARNCLFERIADYHNIRLAFLKAIRGKRSTPEVLLFCRNVDRNLRTIQNRLIAGNIQWGACRSFTITDPKRRVISAAPIEDRILHHAIMNILEPLFERQMIYHTYACRKDRGTHAAIQYAFSKSKGFPWFLKLDIRKYFDSMHHDVLKRLLARLVKDKKILRLLTGIIDSYAVTPGRGLPIGNLTSQFFANLYLSSLDHYILEQLKPCAYVRYMDDFVVWGLTKDYLQNVLHLIRDYTANRLNIQIKEPVFGKTEQGLPFLGFLMKQKGIFLLCKSKNRMKARIEDIKKELAHGDISEEAAAGRITSVYAAVQLARTRRFRVRLWYGNGLASKICGHEPGEPGRELEQQCVQLHGCQPEQQQPQQQEQQQPQQQEQQPWFPGGFAPLSPVKE